MSAASARRILQGVVLSYHPKRSKDLAIVRWVYRPLSFHASVPPILFGMSPNAVTLGNFLLVILAAPLLMSRQSALAYAGVALFLAVFIGDCIDGNMARYLDRRRYFGKLIDGLVDVTVYVLYPAIAIGNVRRGENLFDATYELSAACAILAAMLFISYFRARLALVLAEVRAASSDATSSGKPAESWRRRLVRTAQACFENLGPAGPLLLLLALPLGKVSWLLVAYGIIFVAFAGAEVVYGLARYRKLLDVPRPK